MGKSLKTAAEKILPRHFWLPLVMLITVNCVAYYGGRLLNQGAEFHNAAIALDAAIPFVPPFIVIYVVAYAHWGLDFYLMGRLKPETGYYFAAGLMIAKLLCLATFLAYPTRMFDLPTPQGSDLCSALTRLIYAMDAPADNLFPSIHCLESWMCLRVSLRSKWLPNWAKVANVIFTLLVFASVVLVKQHVLIDIPGGILVGELGLLIARLTKAGRIFPALRRLIFSRERKKTT